jgi:hypothetical protein
LSHSFASNYRLWEPGAARSNFRDTVKQQVLSDRAACLIERYQGRDVNPEEFEARWGEPPLKLSIIRGPGFLQRIPSLEEEDPEPEADGTDRLEPDRDMEWETEEEGSV